MADDYTPTTEEIIDHWSLVKGQAIDPAARERHLERAAMFRRWLTAHDAEKRSEWEAEQVTEEPEWTEDRVKEARIHYRYGVNSGTLDALNTPASIASAISREEQRTMGPIGAHKVETRTKVTRTSPWLPVEQGDAS